jgi:hypothetical protein
MKKLFPLLILILACNDRNPTFNNIVTINSALTEHKTFADVTEIISIDKVIPLETNKNCIIGKIDKIIANKDHFFILDSDYLKNICQFDRNGKFIRLVFSEEEKTQYKITKITAMDILENMVYALNDLKGELYVKDLQENLIRTIRFQDAIYDFKVLTKDTILIYNNYVDMNKSGAYRFRLVECKTSASPAILKKYLPYESNIGYKSLNITNYNRFLQLDSGLLLNEVGNDTLYFFHKTRYTVEPMFVIDYNRPPLKEYFNQTAFRDDIFGFAKENGIGITGFNIHRSGNNLLIGYVKDGYDRSFIYNLKTRKSAFNCDYMQLQAEQMPIPAYWYSDFLNPENAIGFIDIEDLQDEELLKRFENLAGQSLKESINPLIVLLKQP